MHNTQRCELFLFSDCNEPIFFGIWLPNAFLFRLFIFFFLMSVVDLQCCVSFCCTAYDTVTHVCVSLSHTIFLHGLSQETGQRSLCCTGGPHCLSTLNVKSLPLPTPNSPSNPCPPLPLGNHKSLLYVWVCNCFIEKFICAMLYCWPLLSSISPVPFCSYIWNSL